MHHHDISRGNAGGAGSTREHKFSIRFGCYKTLSNPQGMQRFKCKNCGRTFSATFFRLEYKHRTFFRSSEFFRLYNLGLSLCEIARQLHSSEHTMRLIKKRLSEQTLLNHTKRFGGSKIREHLVYDGLENFAFSQYDPNHIQQGIGKDSLFIYDFNYVPLNRKGTRTALQKQKEARIELERGRYSPRAIRDATREIFERLHERIDGAKNVVFYMDEHFQYKRVIEQDLRGLNIQSVTVSSKCARNYQNHLFAVNHADLLVRHNLASFKRETIAFSKTPCAMIESYALFMARKNYMRPQFTKKHVTRPHAHAQTPAMALGIAKKPLKFREFFGCRELCSRVPSMNREWRMYCEGSIPYARELKHAIRPS